MNPPAPAIPLMIIGAGRAGLCLARSLDGHGVRLVGVVSRSRRSAARASLLLGRGMGSTVLAPALARARVILICVPDGAVAGVALSLARSPVRGKIVMHTSGSLGMKPLEPLRKAGARAGCLHPLTTFALPPALPPGLGGVTFAIGGDPAALRVARRLARSVGASAVTVPPGKWSAYHLAASLSANGLVALLDVAYDLARRELGWSERKVRTAFTPLAFAALQNVGRAGTRRALTGPVVRGDHQTIERHREVLARHPAGTRELYLLLASHALRMAKDEGVLNRTEISRLQKLIGSISD